MSHSLFMEILIVANFANSNANGKIRSTVRWSSKDYLPSRHKFRDAQRRRKSSRSSRRYVQIDNSAFSRAGVQGRPNYSGRRIAGRVARHCLQGRGRSAGAQFPVEIQQQRRNPGGSTCQILHGEVERRQRVEIHTIHRAGLRYPLVLGGQSRRYPVEAVSLSAGSSR